MAFEEIEVINPRNPSKPLIVVPDDGVLVRPGQTTIAATRTVNRFIRVKIGAKPEANRECSGPQIDVRSLPEKYLRKPVTVDWLQIQKRSMRKAMRDQLKAHALAFACALFDGYSLEDHIARVTAAEIAEGEERATARANRFKAGACVTCGHTGGMVDQNGECCICADIPF